METLRSRAELQGELRRLGGRQDDGGYAGRRKRMSRIMGNSCRRIEETYAGRVIEGLYHAFEAEHGYLR